VHRFALHRIRNKAGRAVAAAARQVYFFIFSAPPSNVKVSSGHSGIGWAIRTKARA